ncbi:alpha/beta fold hydrolase [Maritimibacter sp. DP1N21-5]|uniref:alpha/beta fold hydrolase n=1 Tax=Maritimibacter sp. DP1N21-5 TaxID=2836867 RepID=UPI001C43737B|nr:alpha/beta fold hydrolase [Maritimibacter sp. DP1N21-5]MBV7410779.1 alpha/beta fold hydrolase [Maritimibacter sp. DP1N21-5]
MTHLIVNALSDGLDVDKSALSEALATLPRSAPVVILIHGFKYAPGVTGHCPHDSILSPQASRRGWKLVSWPRHLGLGQDALVLSFGWEAIGSIWAAYRRAGAAGERLAGFVADLGRPVHMLGHSLGGRVALSALAHAREGSIGRIVLMTGAEFRGPARAATASPAGRRAEVLNVTSRENAVFDMMLSASMGMRGRTVGAGMTQPGWTDLRIDRFATRDRLARLGHPIAAPSARVCHWSTYLRPGLLPLYGAVIRGDLPLSWLAEPADAPLPPLPLAASLSS